MTTNDNNRNGNVGLNTPVIESPDPTSSRGPVGTPGPTDGSEKTEPVSRFSTRTAAKGAEGISKGKLMLLGGGLAVAVLFFVFTADVGKAPKRLAATKSRSIGDRRIEIATSVTIASNTEDGALTNGSRLRDRCLSLTSLDTRSRTAKAATAITRKRGMASGKAHAQQPNASAGGKPSLSSLDDLNAYLQPPIWLGRESI